MGNFRFRHIFCKNHKFISAETAASAFFPEYCIDAACCHPKHCISVCVPVCVIADFEIIHVHYNQSFVAGRCSKRPADAFLCCRLVKQPRKPVGIPLYP